MTRSDDGEMQVHVSDPWMAVAQRHVTAAGGLRLPWARLVLAYVLDLGRRPGWVIYVAEVRRTLGLSDCSWRAARRELQAAGYYCAERHHGADGRWHWVHHIYDVPCGRPATIRRITTHGGATYGAPTRGDVTDRCSTTASITTTGTNTAAARARPAAAAKAAEAEMEPQPQRRQRRREHGVTCWVPGDAEQVAELVAEHGEQAVLATAAQLRGGGTDPLPSVVAASLLAARRRVREAEQAAARRAAAVPRPAVRTTATDAAAEAARAKLAARHLI